MSCVCFLCFQGGCLSLHCRRAAIPIDALYDGGDGGDWDSVQRKLLMQRLRREGRSLRAFWEEALRDFGGKVSASQLQTRIDQLVEEQGEQGGKGRGVVLGFFCQEDCLLTFDDVYDALVCL